VHVLPATSSHTNQNIQNRANSDEQERQEKPRPRRPITWNHRLPRQDPRGLVPVRYKRGTTPNRRGTKLPQSRTPSLREETVENNLLLCRQRPPRARHCKDSPQGRASINQETGRRNSRSLPCRLQKNTGRITVDLVRDPGNVSERKVQACRTPGS